MKYMLLVHHNEDVLAALGDSQLQQLREESVQLANRINSSGQYLDAAPLHTPGARTGTVEIRPVIELAGLQENKRQSHNREMGT